MLLKAQYQAMQSTCPDDNVEANIVPTQAELNLDPVETAMVLVDVWGGHPLKSHYERTGRIMATTLRPCIEAARRARIAVIYAPSPPVARAYPQWLRYASEEELESDEHEHEPDWPPPEFRQCDGKYSSLRRSPNESPPNYHGELPDWWHIRDIAASIAPTPEDFVVATGEQLHRLLRHRRIVHLIYAGFATNICVTYRDYGLQAMRRRGYSPVLLRDCTTGIETRETIAGFAITEAVLKDLERWFYTSDSRAFIQACATVSATA